MALRVMCVPFLLSFCKQADGTLQDFDRITNLLKNNYDVTVDSKDISLRGWNWGKADLQCAPTLAVTFRSLS